MIDFNKLDELTVQIDELEDEFEKGIYGFEKIKSVIKKARSVISDLYVFRCQNGSNADEEIPTDAKEHFENYIAQHPDEFKPCQEGWSILLDSSQDAMKKTQCAEDTLIVDAYMKGAYDLTKAINDGLHELLTHNLA